jgi:hypothetical protein
MERKNNEILIGKRIVSDDCYVVLLEGQYKFIKNNVICIDFSGRVRWNIKDVIQYPQPDYEDAYVSLSKKSDHTFAVTSFGGIYFVINIDTLKIEEKLITK